MKSLTSSAKIFLALAVLAFVLSSALPARAGWNGADGQDSFGRDDVAGVARSLGDAKAYKKAMDAFDKLARQARENDRRMQELQRRYERDAQASQERRESSAGGAAMAELGSSAGGERVSAAMSAPGAGEGAAVDADKKKLSDKDQALWAQCRKAADKITLSPEIKRWVADFFWNVAKYSGGNEPLKEAVGVYNRVRSSEGKYGGYTVKIGPMPDENTYGLYTTGIREIVLRPNMPKDLFLGVLEHELHHGVDDLRDQQNKGGTKISFNWHRDKGDNIFKDQKGGGGSSGGGGKGGCKECPGREEPAAEQAEEPAAKDKDEAAPAEGQPGDGDGAAEQDGEAAPDKAQDNTQGKAQDKAQGDQMDGEYAETYAWRLMGCAGGGKNPVDGVQRCN